MMSNRQNLEAWFAPQERFRNLPATALRRFGRQVVDFSYANSHDGPEEAVRHALQTALTEDRELGFQYTPYGGRTITRRLVASKLTEEYDLPFDYRDVIMTPGAMAAINISLRVLFAPGDEAIVVTPCWLDYPLYLANLGIPFRFVALGADKHLDLGALEGALTANSRAVLFSDPCCPTGVLYAKQEVDALAALLSQAETRFGRALYLISDEVHRHIIWAGGPFCSALQSYPRSLSIYSFGKALFLQGQRIGYVAVSPSMPERIEMRRQLERYVQAMGFCTPTTLMQRAVCRLLDYRPPIDIVAARQRMLRTHLKSYGYEVCDADATFFIYVKSPVSDDFAFAEKMANAGVLVLPSALFHERGFFRISVTARADAVAMERALATFEKVLHELG